MLSNSVFPKYLLLLFIFSSLTFCLFVFRDISMSTEQEEVGLNLCNAIL